MVNEVVLYGIPGPAYLMDADDGTVIKNVEFAGTFCMIFKFKEEVLANQTAFAHKMPSCGQSCTFMGTRFRSSEQFH